MILNQHGLNNLSDAKPKLPEHCVLLDYFTEGNHYGQIQRNTSYADYPITTGIIPNNNHDYLGSTYFDLSESKFKEGLPYAKFQNYGSGGRKPLAKNLSFLGLV